MKIKGLNCKTATGIAMDEILLEKSIFGYLPNNRRIQIVDKLREDREGHKETGFADGSYDCSLSRKALERWS